jgi:hypothetical protein
MMMMLLLLLLDRSRSFDMKLSQRGNMRGGHKNPASRCRYCASIRSRDARAEGVHIGRWRWGCE